MITSLRIQWQSICRAMLYYMALLSCFAMHDVNAAQRTAQFAHLDYDVVYVRCPRGQPVNFEGKETLQNWNGVNDLWLSAANNVYQEPGCDLVLHHSNLPPLDPGAEEVLVDCDEADASKPVCTVADPNVSLDGRYVVYTKFTDTRTFLTNAGVNDPLVPGVQSLVHLYPGGDAPGGGYVSRFLAQMEVYDAPAYIYVYDLQTHTERRVSPTSGFMAGRAYPGKSPDWTGNVPIMDTGPFFLGDGRIGFTSNRDSGFFQFQLFVMDFDGSNLKFIGERAMGNQLHPAMLMDGRIVYTSFDEMLQKTANNNYSLFTINPDGSNPFIFAGKQDATMYTYHYVTQLSDGDVVVTLYYNHNNTGLGSLLRFPVDPPGPDFVHLFGSLNDSRPFDVTQWAAGNLFIPFARKGQFMLTPQASAGDNEASEYSSSADYWTDPVDNRTVVMMGKFSHPSAAPDNSLLVTYAIGGGSTMPDSAFKTSLSATMTVIGKDAGIWLIPLEANSTRQVQHIADDAQIVVDSPLYQEIMPRAVVPYERIYGIPHPAIRQKTPDLGNKDPRLPAGVPYGLTGAASLYDRETRSLNGTPWNMHDGGGVMSGRTYTNLTTSGAELAIFNNSEIYGIRVLMPVPNVPKGIFGNIEQWAGVQKHQLRILGEFPVRKADGTLLDGQGNPDTSFIVKLPADTPFLFQTLDKRGMALDIETTSRDVAPGEQQLCSGCHVHTRDGLDPYQSLAKRDTSAPYGDFTGASAPLFDSIDSNGGPVVKPAKDIYSTLPGSGSRHSFAVDWVDGISDIIQNRCASCHGPGMPAEQQTGLRLDGDVRTYDLLTKNSYTREDGAVIDANTKPGDGLTDFDSPGTDRITPRYSCCTASRWLALNSARSSMLVWALYGQRLDGRDPATGLPPAGSGVPVDNNNLEHPEIWPKVAEHAAYVSGMPESEKRLIARWIDLGAPKLNESEDLMRPVLTVTPIQNGDEVDKVLVGLWDDSPLDYSRFKVIANGADITPTIKGTPDVVEVTLPTPVTTANAGSQSYSFEVWDHPDRSLDIVQPGVPAANRTHKEYTGRGLLRMAGVVTNAAPTSTSATIATFENVTSVGVIPAVADPDQGDSHIFSILSPPSHGTATVVNNRLVYTPEKNYTGADSFTYRATDLGGLFVDGTANVTVDVDASGAESGGGGGIGIEILWLLVELIYRRKRGLFYYL